MATPLRSTLPSTTSKHLLRHPSTSFHHPTMAHHQQGEFAGGDGPHHALPSVHSSGGREEGGGAAYGSTTSAATTPTNVAGRARRQDPQQHQHQHFFAQGISPLKHNAPPSLPHATPTTAVGNTDNSSPSHFAQHPSHPPPPPHHHHHQTPSPVPLITDPIELMGADLASYLLPVTAFNKVQATVAPALLGMVKPSSSSSLRSDDMHIPPTDNVLVEAPTGSGKTVMLELAIIALFRDRLLAAKQGDGTATANEAANHLNQAPLLGSTAATSSSKSGKSSNTNTDNRRKAVYISPIKALATEKFESMSQKFGKVLCVVMETGDGIITSNGSNSSAPSTEDGGFMNNATNANGGSVYRDPYLSLQGIMQADIVITTPERWDSITRRWRDGAMALTLMQSIALLLIDEVHVVGEASQMESQAAGANSPAALPFPFNHSGNHTNSDNIPTTTASGDLLVSGTSSRRGAVLEALVSRMKTIQMAIDTAQPVRLIGVSGTIPNPQDLSEWLCVRRENCFQFRDEDRPVPLTIKVMGYPRTGNPFLFERGLNYKLLPLIQQYSNDGSNGPLKPSIVFCSSRKETVFSACHLADEIARIAQQTHQSKNGHLHPSLAPSNGNNNDANNSGSILESIAGTIILPDGTSMAQAAGSAVDKQLQKCLLAGVGFHHAALCPSDRRLVENLFRTQFVSVCCTTSTLAMGVNLPARLVIVKGTTFYRSDGGGGGGGGGMSSGTKRADIPMSELLQMAGRAGRLGLDHKGVALILTSQDKVPLYRCLDNTVNNNNAAANGKQGDQQQQQQHNRMPPLESQLHLALIDNINAEVALRTIQTVPMALAWVKTTLWWVRLQKNPGYYLSHLRPLLNTIRREYAASGEWFDKLFAVVFKHTSTSVYQNNRNLSSTNNNRIHDQHQQQPLTLTYLLEAFVSHLVFALMHRLHNEHMVVLMAPMSGGGGGGDESHDEGGVFDEDDEDLLVRGESNVKKMRAPFGHLMWNHGEEENKKGREAGAHDAQHRRHLITASNSKALPATDFSLPHLLCEPTQLGKLTAKYYMSFATVEGFNKGLLWRMADRSVFRFNFEATINKGGEMGGNGGKEAFGGNRRGDRRDGGDGQEGVNTKKRDSAHHQKSDANDDSEYARRRFPAGYRIPHRYLLAILCNASELVSDLRLRLGDKGAINRVHKKQRFPLLASDIATTSASALLTTSTAATTSSSSMTSSAAVFDAPLPPNAAVTENDLLPIRTASDRGTNTAVAGNRSHRASATAAPHPSHASSSSPLADGIKETWHKIYILLQLKLADSSMSCLGHEEFSLKSDASRMWSSIPRIAKFLTMYCRFCCNLVSEGETRRQWQRKGVANNDNSGDHLLLDAAEEEGGDSLATTAPMAAASHGYLIPMAWSLQRSIERGVWDYGAALEVAKCAEDCGSDGVHHHRNDEANGGGVVCGSSAHGGLYLKQLDGVGDAAAKTLATLALPTNAAMIDNSRNSSGLNDQHESKGLKTFEDVINFAMAPLHCQPAHRRPPTHTNSNMNDHHQNAMMHHNSNSSSSSNAAIPPDAFVVDVASQARRLELLARRGPPFGAALIQQCLALTVWEAPPPSSALLADGATDDDDGSNDHRASNEEGTGETQRLSPLRPSTAFAQILQERRFQNGLNKMPSNDINKSMTVLCGASMMSNGLTPTATRMIQYDAEAAKKVLSRLLAASSSAHTTTTTAAANHQNEPPKLLVGVYTLILQRRQYFTVKASSSSSAGDYASTTSLNYNAQQRPPAILFGGALCGGNSHSSHASSYPHPSSSSFASAPPTPFLEPFSVASALELNHKFRGLIARNAWRVLVCLRRYPYTLLLDRKLKRPAATPQQQHNGDGGGGKTSFETDADDCEGSCQIAIPFQIVVDLACIADADFDFYTSSSSAAAIPLSIFIYHEGIVGADRRIDVDVPCQTHGITPLPTAPPPPHPTNITTSTTRRESTCTKMDSGSNSHFGNKHRGGGRGENEVEEADEEEAKAMTAVAKGIDGDDHNDLSHLRKGTVGQKRRRHDADDNSTQNNKAEAAEEEAGNDLVAALKCIAPSSKAAGAAPNEVTLDGGRGSGVAGGFINKNNVPSQFTQFMQQKMMMWEAAKNKRANANNTNNNIETSGVSAPLKKDQDSAPSTAFAAASGVSSATIRAGGHGGGVNASPFKPPPPLPPPLTAPLTTATAATTVANALAPPASNFGTPLLPTASAPMFKHGRGNHDHYDTHHPHDHGHDVNHRNHLPQQQERQQRQPLLHSPPHLPRRRIIIAKDDDEDEMFGGDVERLLGIGNRGGREGGNADGIEKGKETGEKKSIGGNATVESRNGCGVRQEGEGGTTTMTNGGAAAATIAMPTTDTTVGNTNTFVIEGMNETPQSAPRTASATNFNAVDKTRAHWPVTSAVAASAIVLPPSPSPRAGNGAVETSAAAAAATACGGAGGVVRSPHQQYVPEGLLRHGRGGANATTMSTAAVDSNNTRNAAVAFRPDVTKAPNRPNKIRLVETCDTNKALMKHNPQQQIRARSNEGVVEEGGGENDAEAAAGGEEEEEVINGVTGGAEKRSFSIGSTNLSSSSLSAGRPALTPAAAGNSFCGDTCESKDTANDGLCSSFSPRSSNNNNNPKRVTIVGDDILTHTSPRCRRDVVEGPAASTTATAPSHTHPHGSSPMTIQHQQQQPTAAHVVRNEYGIGTAPPRDLHVSLATLKTMAMMNGKAAASPSSQGVGGVKLGYYNSNSIINNANTNLMHMMSSSNGGHDSSHGGGGAGGARGQSSSSSLASTLSALFPRGGNGSNTNKNFNHQHQQQHSYSNSSNAPQPPPPTITTSASPNGGRFNILRCSAPQQQKQPYEPTKQPYEYANATMSMPPPKNVNAMTEQQHERNSTTFAHRQAYFNQFQQQQHMATASNNNHQHHFLPNGPTTLASPRQAQQDSQSHATAYFPPHPQHHPIQHQQPTYPYLPPASPMPGTNIVSAAPYVQPPPQAYLPPPPLQASHTHRCPSANMAIMTAMMGGGGVGFPPPPPQMHLQQQQQQHDQQAIHPSILMGGGGGEMGMGMVGRAMAMGFEGGEDDDAPQHSDANKRSAKGGRKRTACGVKSGLGGDEGFYPSATAPPAPYHQQYQYQRQQVYNQQYYPQQHIQHNAYNQQQQLMHYQQQQQYSTGNWWE